MLLSCLLADDALELVTLLLHLIERERTYSGWSSSGMSGALQLSTSVLFLTGTMLCEIVLSAFPACFLLRPPIIEHADVEAHKQNSAYDLDC